MITLSSKTIRLYDCAVVLSVAVDVDGSVSSQFLTALLMTAPLAPQDTTIAIKGELVSKPYIDITLNLMKTFGVEIENRDYQHFVVKGGQQYQSWRIRWKGMRHRPRISLQPERLKAVR